MTRQLKNRMAVGGIVHETVSYLPAATTLADFERRAVRGDEIAEAFAGSNTVFGGFLDVCQQNGVAVEGLICAECAPSGPVSKKAIQALADEFGLARYFVAGRDGRFVVASARCHNG